MTWSLPFPLNKLSHFLRHNLPQNETIVSTIALCLWRVRKKGLLRRYSTTVKIVTKCVMMPHAACQDGVITGHSRYTCCHCQWVLLTSPDKVSLTQADYRPGLGQQDLWNSGTVPGTDIETRHQFHIVMWLLVVTLHLQAWDSRANLASPHQQLAFWTRRREEGDN